MITGAFGDIVGFILGGAGGVPYDGVVISQQQLAQAAMNMANTPPGLADANRANMSHQLAYYSSENAWPALMKPDPGIDWRQTGGKTWCVTINR